MRITDRLKVEHGVYLQQLRTLRELLALKAPRPVLAAVVDTIASSEELHSEIEERTVYPALIKALGPAFPALAAVASDHAAIRTRLARIRSGDFDESDVADFASVLHDHLEREIHSLFALADEWLTEQQLTSMCNWNVEHVYEAAGQRELWLRQWMSAPSAR
jgi:Hemerythrin HHE cation binding domain